MQAHFQDYVRDNVRSNLMIALLLLSVKLPVHILHSVQGNPLAAKSTSVWAVQVSIILMFYFVSRRFKMVLTGLGPIFLVVYAVAIIYLQIQ